MSTFTGFGKVRTTFCESPTQRIDFLSRGFIFRCVAADDQTVSDQEHVLKSSTIPNPSLS
jgi:hypothetical protein